MKIIYEIKDAKIEDGGEGAFYIYLKNKNKLRQQIEKINIKIKLINLYTLILQNN